MTSRYSNLSSVTSLVLTSTGTVKLRITILASGISSRPSSANGTFLTTDRYSTQICKAVLAPWRYINSSSAEISSTRLFPRCVVGSEAFGGELFVQMDEEPIFNERAASTQHVGNRLLSIYVVEISLAVFDHEP